MRIDNTLLALYGRWRQKAELFRQHGHEATARAYELCSTELEEALTAGENELLDLQEAARESGYSADYLGRLVRAGRIRNAGRRNAPRIRRGDLPKRPEVAETIHLPPVARLEPMIPRGSDPTLEHIAREALASKAR